MKQPKKIKWSRYARLLQEGDLIYFKEDPSDFMTVKKVVDDDPHKVYVKVFVEGRLRSIMLGYHERVKLWHNL